MWWLFLGKLVGLKLYIIKMNYLYTVIFQDIYCNHNTSRVPDCQQRPKLAARAEVSLSQTKHTRAGHPLNCTHPSSTRELPSPLEKMNQGWPLRIAVLIPHIRQQPSFNKLLVRIIDKKTKRRTNHVDHL